MASAASEVREAYAATGVAPVGSVLDQQTVTLLSSYVSVLGQTDRLHAEEKQVEGSLVLYGDAMFDTVMASFSPVVAAVVERPVVPTYSFLRVYFEGQVLTRHRDRRACQHSITVHLAAAEAEPWPVEFSDLNGQERAVALGPGDAALYQGCAVAHWRRPCPVEWYVQAFFHYVEADGPFAGEALDGRPYLGLPTSSRRVHGAP